METLITERDRIEQLMAAENVNAAQFSQETGIKTATLSHILTGRNKPSFNVLKKILNRYPTISSDWLLFGVGSMNFQKSNSQAPSLFDEYDETRTNSANYELKEDKNKSTTKERIRQISIENETKPLIQIQSTDTFAKKVEKIIVYYSDNSFQEFYPK